MLQERERVHSGKALVGPRQGGKATNSPGERRQEERLHGMVTIKDRIKVQFQNFQDVLLKA
jgi:hypothetical protein